MRSKPLVLIIWICLYITFIYFGFFAIRNWKIIQISQIVYFKRLIFLFLIAKQKFIYGSIIRQK